MKSFIQFINENWSTVKNHNDIPIGKREKFIYHVTHNSNVNSILDTGLQPRDETSKSNFNDLGDSNSVYVTNHHGISSWIQYLSMKKPKQSDYSVLKFPISNLTKNLKRKIKMDVSGTKDATSLLATLKNRSPASLPDRTIPRPRGKNWSWAYPSLDVLKVPIGRAWKISRSIT